MKAKLLHLLSEKFRLRAAGFFIYSAGALFLITAAGKAMGGFGTAAIFHMSDPVMMIPSRYVFFAAGGIELAAALICLFRKELFLRTGLIAWLATVFLAYRITLWIKGWHGPCICTGNLADLLGVSPWTADLVSKIVLAYLLLGSYGFLTFIWLNRPKVVRLNKPAAPSVQSVAVKFSCTNPTCRQHIMVDESRFGRQIQCPACGTILQVPTIITKP